MAQRIVISLLFLIGFFEHCHTQAAKPAVSIKITAQHGNWNVKAGDMTSFAILVSDSNNLPIKNASIKYEIGPEMLKPFLIDSAVLANGKLNSKPFTLYRPGFLRCVATIFVNGVPVKKIHTVGYDVERIQPTVKEPADFDSFWESSKKELAKVPINSNLKFLPDRSSATVNVYHVGMSNIGNTKFYGILAVPKKVGKYPAVLQVPGAGVRPYSADLALAEKGVVVFTVGIHGIPVNLDSAVYTDLGVGALNRYFYFNMNNRDRYYYKRVYLGCIRAIDFLFTLDQFDKKNLGLYGGSQGGALSVVSSALDKRVKRLVVFCPALCDVTGYLENRAGGWPHIFANDNFDLYYNKENVNTLSYYDVVNFAKRLKISGFYSWGYNDIICPPTSMYSAYNVINAPKKLSLYYELGHWLSPEQKKESTEWMLSQLK